MLHKISIPTPFPVGPVNVYLLKGKDCLTLVDTGPKTVEAQEALEAGLRAVGVRVEDLDQILLTHYHCDHVGLLENLVEQSGAKVYAHPFTEPLIAREPAFEAARSEFYQGLYRGLGLTEAQKQQAIGQIYDYLEYVGVAHVDVALREGDRLPGHEEWQVVYTPGHALDHLSLYDAVGKRMLLGDHVIKKISSNAFIEPPHRAGDERPRMLMIYREALRKVQTLDWEIGYAGHGEEITGHRDLITKRLADMERRQANVLETVRSGKTTGVEITLAMFPRHLEQLTLIISETVGHLDWLVAEGKLRVEDDNGLWRYFAVEE
ncbi:MBL fold metallo-hydrolase [Tumebacillus permanentifrigoris]|uniref:Glyoxylase-like metal-dependent hydrolase (Beta-lactamase superfamily II) n=1 Tax=Tumebacillus permanentifrigoris TaxID=378543 RepID=A0A316D8K5_9BACL|nr:MBL fold metallo-hydrolase [Tumebacillus permanentifrigoris]PWK11263.1 glyoxylase-like metal-dependent hydrolase (beta-lactamase superfamily II) [Tumebacillus permanentifrigoris]